jgi:hypothetical protein
MNFRASILPEPYFGLAENGILYHKALLEMDFAM